MNSKRFVGINSRDALQQVRAELGDDPFIVSNKKIPEGVEIIAVCELDFQPSSNSSYVTSTSADVSKNLKRGFPGLDKRSMNEILLDEVRGVKALLLNDKENGVECSNQQKLNSSLQRSGFSVELSEDISQCYSTSRHVDNWEVEEIAPWVTRQVELRLPCGKSGDQLLREGGVIALIGPTGVGKTTTTAKLAAQVVMSDGPKDVAIISMDNFRVGAHEQLRIYAKLLGVDFFALGEKDSLDKILMQLRKKKLVLIDTVGLSQRDGRVREQFQDMAGLDTKINFLLLLNGTSQAATLDEVVACYRESLISGGVDIEYCIFTKLDEAVSAIPVLGCAVQHHLNPVFVSAGQKVPEDIEAANVATLIEKPLLCYLEQEKSISYKACIPPASWSRNLLSQGRQLGVVLRVLRENIEGFSYLEDLWDISMRSQALQQPSFDNLLQQRRLQSLGQKGIAWAKNQPIRGCYFQCPDMVLSESGGFLPISFLQHRQPVDDLQKLTAVASQFATDWHVFSSIPSEKLRRWLHWEEKDWVSEVSLNSKAGQGGLKQHLCDIETGAEFYDEIRTRFKGQTACLHLSRSAIHSSILEVDTPGTGYQMNAWFGRIQSVESGTILQEFRWVGAGQEDIGKLLSSNVSLSSFSSLVRKGWFCLDAIPGFQFCRDLRISVAAGMAATAINLEVNEADWAVELRGRICDIHGSKRRVKQSSIFDALTYIFLAREAFNHGLTN